MDELVTWLREVLDETERIAKKATYGPWYQDGMSVRATNDRMWGTEGRFVEQKADTLVVKHTWPNEAALMVRHDPRSVLARVEAERAIVQVYDYSRIVNVDNPGDVLFEDESLKLAVRALAYGHRHDAPGYRPEWAPEGAPVSASESES